MIAKAKRQLSKKIRIIDILNMMHRQREDVEAGFQRIMATYGTARMRPKLEQEMLRKIYVIEHKFEQFRDALTNIERHIRYRDGFIKNLEPRIKAIEAKQRVKRRKK